jgi:hypothetical protein
MTEHTAARARWGTNTCTTTTHSMPSKQQGAVRTFMCPSRPLRMTLRVLCFTFHGPEPFCASQ